MAIFDLDDPRNVVEQLCTQFSSKRIIFIRIDVRNRQDFEKAFQSTVDQFESVDGIINSAGIVRETSPEDTIGVNVIGVINSTQVALEHMSVEKGGRGGFIVNIASVLGLDYVYTIPLYNASKHAVVGYTRSMADKKLENIFGVKFVTICPGFTDTPLLDEFDKVLHTEEMKEEHVNFIAKRGMQT